MFLFRCWPLSAAALLCCRFGAPTSAVADTPMGFETGERQVLLIDDGKPIGRFVFDDPVIRRPFVADLKTAPTGDDPSRGRPGSLQTSRRHPPVAGEDAVDHDTMHPGLWFALGDLNGEDFWRNKGTIRHDRFVKPVELRRGIHIATESTLLRADGRTLGRQSLKLHIAREGRGYLYLWEIGLRGETEALDFGVQEEMGFGARMATPLAEKAGGVVTSADGRTGAKTIWGTRDRWCDYSGALDGRHVGMTIMPHPKNPRPTWWHTRDYGVFVANGFGPRSVEKDAEPRLKVPAGETIVFRYGVFVHDDAAEQKPDLDAVYRKYLTLADGGDDSSGATSQ